MKPHKGYTYLAEQEYDGDDCSYIYHYAVGSEGNRIRLDYSGWTDMNEEAFETLIDLDFPDRPTELTPWTLEDLKEVRYAQNFTMNNDNLTDL